MRIETQNLPSLLKHLCMWRPSLPGLQFAAAVDMSFVSSSHCLHLHCEAQAEHGVQGFLINLTPTFQKTAFMSFPQPRKSY